MGFFSRLSTLIRANLNDLIASAEDPEKILEQCILDMRENLLEARKQVASAIADEKRLRKQLEAELARAQSWEKKARTAVRAGRDDLAREALVRKTSHDALAAEFQQQWELQKAATDKLRGALRGLQSKIEEATRRKNLLKARAQRIKAQRTIQETLGSIGQSSAADTFDRMAEKIEREEAIVEAGEELAREDAYDVGAEIDALGQEAEAQDALDSLKRQMGLVEEPGLELEPVSVGASRKEDSWDAF